jgi:hypothetical protein
MVSRNRVQLEPAFVPALRVHLLVRNCEPDVSAALGLAHPSVRAAGSVQERIASLLS